ncbi:MAG: hypothetical protein ACREJ6_10135 [Candidatus Methylomirabilis sp.]
MPKREPGPLEPPPEMPIVQEPVAYNPGAPTYDANPKAQVQQPEEPMMAAENVQPPGLQQPEGPPPEESRTPIAGTFSVPGQGKARLEGPARGVRFGRMSARTGGIEPGLPPARPLFGGSSGTGAGAIPLGARGQAQGLQPQDEDEYYRRIAGRVAGR